jgi:hypothetical protein
VSKPTKKTFHHYSAFGLHIAAAFPLPELRRTEAGPADVEICLGDVPGRLTAPLEEGPYHQAGVGEFLLRVEGVAAYYISGGRQIIVQPYVRDDFRDIRLFLLGTTMGVVLMQRGVIAMHGSAVVIDGQGVILTGFTGAGKSTLAGSLRKQGFALVSDDVSAISRDAEGTFWVQPGYPQQKLDQSSAAMIGINTDGLKRVGDRDKFAIPLGADFHPRPAPIKAIYVIVAENRREASVAPLTVMERLTAVMENTYRVELINGMGLKVPHFQLCTALAKHTPVFLLTRPRSGSAVDRQAAALIQHCRRITGS